MEIKANSIEKVKLLFETIKKLSKHNISIDDVEILNENDKYIIEINLSEEEFDKLPTSLKYKINKDYDINNKTTKRE